MNSLESVRELLETYLEETCHYDDDEEKADTFHEKGTNHNQRVYDAFFNLISDPYQTPEDLVNIIHGFTSDLNGFTTNRPLQSYIAFACFESLAERNIEVLTEPWENLLWTIVKYSFFLSSTYVFFNNPTFDFNKEKKAATLPWLEKFTSKELCPDPCLRLELIRVIQAFSGILAVLNSTIRENFIITLLELSDKYESLTVDQLPNFSPEELKSLISTYRVYSVFKNINDDFYMRKSEIIAAVLKLSKSMALIEKEKCIIRNNQFININQLRTCVSFCGLVQLAPANAWPGNLIHFIQIVSNNPLLMHYTIETLETVTRVALYFQDDELIEMIESRKREISHEILKRHTNKISKHHYLHEINGGSAPTVEYCLRYFQNNILHCSNKSNNSAPEENDY